MFGYVGGDSPEMRARKIAERASAKAKWPFITSLDLSLTHSEDQLAALVKERVGFSAPDTRSAVRSWMRGYLHRTAKRSTNPRGRSATAAAIERWTNEGGAAPSLRTHHAGRPIHPLASHGN